MRAIVAEQSGGPDVLKLVDLPKPEPGPGEVRIAVEICGLNPLDLMARRGAAPWLVTGWPQVLGVEHSGTVDAVGAGVDEGWLGRRVTSTTVLGGNADYSLSPAARLIACPEGVDPATAAVYRGASHTSWRILDLYAPRRAGGWVFIHSIAGTVGPVLTQLAKARGFRVIGTTSSQAKADWAQQFGADHILVGTDADWVTRTREATGGAGVDLVVDGNGGAQAARNPEIMAPLATCVLVGATSGTPAPAVESRTIITQSIAVAGFNLPLVEGAAGDAQAVDAAIVAMLRDGRLRMPIGDEGRLEDIPALHRAFEARELRGRTIIRIKD